MGLRSLKRSAKKAQYEKFSRAWKDEKRFQKYLIEVQEAPVVYDGKTPDGNPTEYIVSPEGERIPVLGRKPTFAMWNRAVDNQQRMQQSVQDTKKAEVDDLSWEEDTVRQNSRSTSETEGSS